MDAGARVSRQRILVRQSDRRQSGLRTGTPVIFRSADLQTEGGRQGTLSSAAHEVLDQYIKTLDNVTIDFNTDGVKLLANDKGQVLSVEAVTEDGKTIKYTANKGVVMATGGYSGNFKLWANTRNTVRITSAPQPRWAKACG